jgi:hypothetical protein
MKNDLWAHLVCVNWIPEIWFDKDKTTLQGEILAKRYSMTCLRCKRKEGVIIQCDWKNCAKSYHVRCACRAGHIQNAEEMEKVLGRNDGVWDIPVFCSEHRSKGYKIFNEKGKEGVKTKKRKGIRRIINKTIAMKGLS